MIESVFVYANDDMNIGAYSVHMADGTIEDYPLNAVPVSIISWINKAEMFDCTGFLWFKSKEPSQSCAGTPLWIEREEYISKQTEPAPVIKHPHY